MRSFVSALGKFFTKERAMILVIFVLLSLFLLSYSSNKVSVVDGYESGTKATEKKDAKDVKGKKNDPKQMPKDTKKPQKMEASGDKKEGFTTKNVNRPDDLLPHDANKEWETFNPMTHNSPDTPDLLTAGYHIGLDTVGQTMKNANLQLRSDPVIQKKEIGPWNQSTIEPDMMRVPLEVGSVH